MEDVKELKQAAIAAVAVAMKLIKLSKDGIDFSDVAALLADEELMGMLKAAADGASKIPAEIKDIDVAEGFELAGVIIPMILIGLK